MTPQPKPARRGPKPRKALRRSTPVRKRSPKRSAVEAKDREWSRVVRFVAGPLCEYADCTRPATDAHHIYGKKAHPLLRWTSVNGIGLCRPCHRAWHRFPKSRRAWFAAHYPGSWLALQTFVRDSR